MTASSASPRVPWASRSVGALFARRPGLARALGALESRVLRSAIDQVPIRAPVYVCGMARSGSTLLLELLARHPAFTSHRYSDYPGVFTPYWWNRLRLQALPAPRPAAPRAHADRILVHFDSPEAFEEPLWMAFMPWLHRGQRDEWLDASHQAPEFERFHRDHLRKLLLVRGAARYLAKANTLLTRLPYLHRLYPDARIVLPLRSPEAQVASLVRQDAHFRRLAESDPDIAPHLARTGHFEFGPQKRALRGADTRTMEQIHGHWQRDETATGYALLWRELHGGILTALRRDPALREACLLLPYDRLCAQPEANLRRLFEHVRAHDADAMRLIAETAPGLSEPAYYTSPLKPSERQTIRTLCDPLWRELMHEADAPRSIDRRDPVLDRSAPYATPPAT